MDIATLDVKENCQDLKVLGKGDFKALIKWRVQLREEVRIRQFFYLSLNLNVSQLGLDGRIKCTEDITEPIEVGDEMDEEQQISEEVNKWQ